MYLSNFIGRKGIFIGLLALLCLSLWGSVRSQPLAAEAEGTFPNPKFTLTSPATISFASVSAVDLDHDGDLEILTADSDGRVWAWNHNGSPLPGYPLRLNTNGERVNTPLAIADINGDNRPEIAAGTRGSDSNAPGQRGKVYMWTWNQPGVWLPGWPHEMTWNSSYGDGTAEVYSVVFGNVSGDTNLEVIVGTNDNASLGGSQSINVANLHVWTADGAPVGNYPTGYRTAGIYGHVAAADLTGNGKVNPITGRDHLYVYAYDANGNSLTGDPYLARTPVNQNNNAIGEWGTYDYMEFTRGAPAVGDLDGNGTMEIVIAGKVRGPVGGKLEVTGNGLIVLQPNGRRMRGWEIAKVVGPNLSDEFKPSQAPSLADLTGDGKLEIVVPFADGFIRAYRYDGTLLWAFNYAQGGQIFASEAAIGDVNGDTLPDVVFGTYSPEGRDADKIGLHALMGATGVELSNYPLALPQDTGDAKRGIRGAPAIVDLDGDCLVDIVAASRKGTVYVWEPPAPYFWDKMPWPLARHDNLRTGSTEGPLPFTTTACDPSEPLIPQAYLPAVQN